MFNKKKKRIEMLEVIVLEKNALLNKQAYKIKELQDANEELKKSNDAFARAIDKQAGELDKTNKVIEKQNKKIAELEACFKPQVINCEEEPKQAKKTPKKTSKTQKRA